MAREVLAVRPCPHPYTGVHVVWRPELSGQTESYLSGSKTTQLVGTKEWYPDLNADADAAAGKASSCGSRQIQISESVCKTWISHYSVHPDPEVFIVAASNDSGLV
jgi:hypothetical protein